MSITNHVIVILNAVLGFLLKLFIDECRREGFKGEQLVFLILIVLVISIEIPYAIAILIKNNKNRNNEGKGIE